MNERNLVAAFILLTLALMFSALGYSIYDSNKAQEAFTSKCGALNGEVAKRKGQLICVDPRHVLLTLHLRPTKEDRRHSH